MGDWLNLLKENRWGLTALGAGATALVASGLVTPGSTEGRAFGAGAVGAVVVGCALLLRRLLKGGQPPAGPTA